MTVHSDPDPVKMREALEFYANGDNWEVNWNSKPPVVAVKADKGHRARVALGRHL